MTIDRRHIGHVLPAFDVPVEPGRLRFFAKATGQNDPVYFDLAAARDTGHPHLPVPPTFLFCLEMEAPDPAAMRKLLGIDYRRILHGEQHFRYHAMAHAGDVLHFEPRIVDIDFARAAGMDDVIAHGMLAFAYAARLVTGWIPQRALESLSARFVAVTKVGDRLACSGRIAEKLDHQRVRIVLSVADQHGVQKLAGEAVVVLE